MFDNFINSNSLKMRLLRTILEGILSIIVVSVPIIVGWWALTPEQASILTAILMAIFTPILALLKTGKPEDALKKDETEE